MTNSTRPSVEEADTRDLSLAATGAYFGLMLHYFGNGSLPTDDEAARKIVGASSLEWTSIREELQERLFTKDWRHERWERQRAEPYDENEESPE